MSLIENPSSYSIQNFIPFMDEVYFRLFERQFEAWWPAHLVMCAVSLAILTLACMGKNRMLAIALAIPFASCALTFHFKLYAELTPIGTFFGWAFLVQIPLVLIWGFTTKYHEKLRLNAHAIMGVVIALFATLGYPLLSLLSERTWQGAAYVGMTPDPTICFFLGIALITSRAAWFLLLLPIPLLWTFVTWGTLDHFDAPFALALPIVAALTIATAIGKATFQRSSAEGIRD